MKDYLLGENGTLSADGVSAFETRLLRHEPDGYLRIAQILSLIKVVVTIILLAEGTLFAISRIGMATTFSAFAEELFSPLGAWALILFNTINMLLGTVLEGQGYSAKEIGPVFDLNKYWKVVPLAAMTVMTTFITVSSFYIAGSKDGVVGLGIFAIMIHLEGRMKDLLTDTFPEKKAHLVF